MATPSYKLTVSHIGIHKKPDEYPCVTLRVNGDQTTAGFVSDGVVMDELRHARLYWTKDNKYAAMVGEGSDGKPKLWEFEPAKGSE